MTRTIIFVTIILINLYSFNLFSQNKTAEIDKKGKVETKSKTEYYKGHLVYTGKRGGKYYLTKSGRKVYINHR